MSGISFRLFADHFANERGLKVTRESLVGTRAIAYLSDGSQWELGKIMFGRFTPHSDAVRVSDDVAASREETRRVHRLSRPGLI